MLSVVYSYIQTTRFARFRYLVEDIPFFRRVKHFYVGETVCKYFQIAA